ncbi:MAG: Mut7-C RNAse domain-containing protein [bacterium]
MKENTAQFRVYEELNDFLPLCRRKVWFEHRFNGYPPIKDIIVSLGIPPAQVDLILINGESADFSHQVQDGDRISVFPVFESLDISTVSRLRPKPLRDLKFILDGGLGHIAEYLRRCGFDVVHQHDCSEEFIIRTAGSSSRIVLTRNKELLRKGKITRGYLIRGAKPGEQIQEIVLRFNLLPEGTVRTPYR